MIEKTIEVSNFITPFTSLIKGLSNEWSNLMDEGLNRYLHDQTQKYYFTNTFIHRGEQIVFKDIYYPIKCKFNHLTTTFSNITDVLESYKAITIVGTAGSGKTTLVKYIFLNAIQNKTKIPLLIELRNLNNANTTLDELICNKILKTKAKPGNGILERSLRSGKFLFLFDGYDEIFSANRQKINSQIDAFVDSYPENNFIITTRPGGGIESFPRFHDFSVLPLNDGDVLKFIEKIVENPDRRERIKQIVKDSNSKNYREYLRNPLLLSMFIMAFESHPEIPGKRSAFYSNVFDTLYSKHDGITKNSYPREKLSGLERDDFESILNTLCYISITKGHYSFTHEQLTDLINLVKSFSKKSFNTDDLIKDLHTTISILTLDGFEYRFPHRSMQEYFAARFLAYLPDESKFNAMRKLNEHMSKSSNDKSSHFWSLCQELDNHGFIKYYLIPELESIVVALTGNSDEDYVERYLKFTRLAFYVPNLKSPELQLIRYITHYTNLLEYCKAENFSSFYDPWVYDKFKAQVLAEININSLPVEVPLDLTDRERKVFAAYYLPLIKEQCTLIESRINDLRSEIVSNNDRLNNILNFN